MLAMVCRYRTRMYRHFLSLIWILAAVRLPDVGGVEFTDRIVSDKRLLTKERRLRQSTIYTSPKFNLLKGSLK
jgi:hypothetical protein